MLERNLQCDEVCRLTWGFRLVLLWSYWSFLFILIALYSSLHLLYLSQQRSHQLLLQRVKDGEFSDDDEESDPDLNFRSNHIPSTQHHHSWLKS